MSRVQMRDQRRMARDMRRMRRYMRTSARRNTVDRSGRIGAAASFFWQYRSELGPFCIVFSLVVLAAAAHRMWDLGPIVVIILLCLVAGVVMARRNDRQIERVYALSVTVLGCGWWLAAAISGPGRGPLPVLLVLGGTIAAAPWWAHRRRRSRVRVERTIRAWPELADNAGLAGSRAMSAVVDAFGYTARVALRRGMSARTAIGRTDEIASMLGVRPGSVRVTADPDREDHVIVRVTETDPLNRPNPWPGLGDISPTITRPMPLGVFEDGTVVTVSLLRRHLLIGGVVGAGKSGVVNCLLASLVAADDVTVWGIDLKGGMELGPWGPSMGLLATDPTGAENLLSDALDELRRRTRELAERGERIWTPTREKRALVVVVDEFAELSTDALVKADSVARLGRAVAVTLVAATQRPTQEAMGNGAIRSQMDARIALRVRERGDSDLILGAGTYKSGWRTDGFTLPGAFLIFDPDHTTPVPARAYLIDDETVAGITARYPAPLAIPTVAERPTPLDADEALWIALTDAHAGIGVTDLVSATGRSRRWVYYALQQLHTAGKIHQREPGRWQITDPK